MTEYRRNMQETELDPQTAAGVVFSVQRYTVHDGPGTRTQVFLKGCPLRCQWCDNPESWSTSPQIGVYPTRCIGVDVCGLCIKACPRDGLLTIKDNLVTAIDRDKCTECLACAEECPANALTVWGHVTDVEQQLAEVLLDREFFDQTGGGVTLSGGKPFVQWEFARDFFKAAKKAGLHTCLESALPVNWDIIEEVLPYIDFIITDIKHMDDSKHREYTGVSNRLILENIVKITHEGKPVIIRIPVIPGKNDTTENIAATAEFIAGKCGASIVQVQLLGFHELGKLKYQSLGLDYPLERLTKPPLKDYKEHLHGLAAIMKARGIKALVGSTTKL